MKTNNILKSVVIAVVTLFTASVNAQAQQRAKLHDQAVVASIVGDSLQGASGCSHLKVHVTNSLVDRVDCYVHSGFYAKLEGAGSFMKLSSTDKGDDNTNSVGGEFSLGYDWCKRTWPVAVGVEATAGGYTNTKIEGYNTKAFIVKVKVPITVAPHGILSAQIAPMLGYRNVTSSTDINTEYLSGDVSGNWNAFQLGGDVNVLVTLFSIKTTKTMDVAGQMVKAVKHRPVRLVLGAEYSHMNVDKPIINGVSNKLSINELILKAGLKVTF